MKLLQFLGLTVLTTLAAGSLHADVLNFDSLSTGTSSALIAPGYGGFNWGPDFGVISSAYYQSFYGTAITFPSTPNAAFNGLGVPAVTMSGAPFAFNGADFASFVQSNQSQCVPSSACSSTSVTVHGFLGGNLVATQTFNLASNGSFSSFTANSGFSNVDRLDFLSDGVPGPGRWWLMDDLTITRAPSAVPEPSSVISLATVLGALLLGARRKLFHRAA
jgi:hypothetical protein